MLKYICAVVVSIFVFFGVFLLIILFLSSFTWYPEDPLYQFLKFIRNNIYVTIGVLLFIIIIANTLVLVYKLIGFLKETIQATSQILEKPERNVEISKDLVGVQEEMNKLREANNFAKRAAKESEQRKNDLVVYLAHDLRTPLTSVIGYLTLLKEEPQISQEIRSKYTGIALNKAERLEQLIGDFFEITRFNLTSLTMHTENVNVSIMLEQISYEFLPILEKNSLQWNLDIQQNVYAVIDVEKMERVFDNLIRNAINYSFAESTISLCLKAENEVMQIRFTNSGYTISEEKLERIFEPFYRMDSSRASKTGGTGLGLPIAKEIVEVSGGTIKAESGQNQISFCITMDCQLL